MLTKGMENNIYSFLRNSGEVSFKTDVEFFYLLYLANELLGVFTEFNIN